MVFNKKSLDKIPGIQYHPFMYDQNNLLTLKLPRTIKHIGRSAFWFCLNLHYINLIDLVNLENIEREWICGTNMTKVDLRNTKLTTLEDYVFSSNESNYRNINFEYILLPNTISKVYSMAFNNQSPNPNKIKTLMTPTLSYPNGNWYIEDQITDNLIINKIDGLGNLHYFNGDTIIWVPDEWYDKYIEYYTGNTNYENWQDIINRLKKYSEGVPEFPYV